MTVWAQRSKEERGLLNPGFCSILLWYSAYGRQRDRLSHLSFEESFLILPFVLHRQTREELPRTIRTSMPVWLEQFPLARGRIASRAKLLVPFTKEALTFAGVHKIIQIQSGRVIADPRYAAAINKFLRDTSDEVQTCAKKADFVGKWFAQTGNAATVLAVVGVRP